jgi:hypothetical protein
MLAESLHKAPPRIGQGKTLLKRCHDWAVYCAALVLQYRCGIVECVRDELDMRGPIRIFLAAISLTVFTLDARKANAQSSHEMMARAGVPGSVQVLFDRRTPSLGSFQLQF